MNWNRKMNNPLPNSIMLSSTQDPQCWIAAAIDSNGAYTATLPAGKYSVNFLEHYFHSGGENIRFTIAISLDRSGCSK